MATITKQEIVDALTRLGELAAQSQKVELVLLQELPPAGGRDAVWDFVEPYLVPGRELKAQYAFWDLWESLYGED